MKDSNTCLVNLQVADIMAGWRPGHADRTWTEEEAEIRSRICCCCGNAGHYQDCIEAKMAADGLWWDELTAPILSAGGRVWDGHHRIIGAHKLGWRTLLVLANPVQNPK